MKIDTNGFLVSYIIFIIVYSYHVNSLPMLSKLDLLISIVSVALAIVIPVLVFILCNYKNRIMGRVKKHG